MPLVRIEIIKGQSEDYKKALHFKALQPPQTHKAALLGGSHLGAIAPPIIVRQNIAKTLSFGELYFRIQKGNAAKKHI